MTVNAVNVATTVSGKEKFFAPDFVRAVAIVLVIVIHVVCPYMNDFSHSNFWNIANFIESAARPCVPLFFMLTGYLLLDSRSDESLSAFYKKRFSRILIPFFFWAAVYFGWRHFYHQEPMHLSKMLHELYSGPIFYHFGFMFALISIYLVAPFIRLIVRGLSFTNLLWLLALWFVGQTLPAASIKFFHAGFTYSVEVVTRYSGYFIAGYCFSRIRPTPAQTALLCLATVAAYASTVYGTAILNEGSKGPLDEFFYDYFSPNVIAASISSFILLLNLGHRLESANKLFKLTITTVGSTTLGIYLMQSLVIEAVNIPWQGLNPALYTPAVTLYVLVICVFVCAGVSKIPF